MNSFKVISQDYLKTAKMVAFASKTSSESN